MAARLRHQSHDLAVPVGMFLIGRGADCALALDDVLVSRRHAAVRVADDGSAVLEDLNSRNGVFLNGVRVQKPEQLRDGDLIRIGSQDICFYNVDDGDGSGSVLRATRVTLQYIPHIDALQAMDAASPLSTVPVTEPDPIAAPPPPPSSRMAGPPPPSARSAPSAPPPSASPSSAPSPSAPPPSAPISAKPSSRVPLVMSNPVVRELPSLLADDVDESTSISSSPLTAGGGKASAGLAIIGSVADKALALGRVEEAERILQRSLQDILARAQPKGEIEPDVAERAAMFALRLAAGTGRGAWIDYVFQLYTKLRALPPGRLVDELYSAVRKVKSTDKGVRQAYTACLKQISSGFGPAERFVQQRIESFERWAP